MTNDKKVLRFVEAICRVKAKHLEMGALIAEGHRRVASKVPGVDPTVTAVNMDIGLAQASGTPAHSKAALELVKAILQVWYKMPVHLKTHVMQSVRDVAYLHGEDEASALLEFDTVLAGARGSADVSAERLKTLKKEKAARDRAYEQKQRRRMQDRLHRETL